MTNADVFHSQFGIYASELWAMPEKEFLDWLNSEYRIKTEIDHTEKVIKGLECCSNGKEKPSWLEKTERNCEKCPYNLPGVACTRAMAYDALSLLKAQEPRVMTLEEVKAMDRLTYCVIEPHSKVIKNTFNAEYRGIVTIGTDNFLDFGLYADTNPYRRTDAGYGKSWRCWTSRPTEAQRKATPWNEGQWNRNDKG